MMKSAAGQDQEEQDVEKHQPACHSVSEWASWLVSFVLLLHSLLVC